MKLEKDSYGIWKFDLLVILVLIIGTLFACDNSSEEYQLLEPVGEDIAPGSVIVIAKVISYGGKDNEYLLHVRIEKVLGYGPATNEITESTYMDLKIQYELMEGYSLNVRSEMLQTFTFEIRQPKEGSNDYWKVVRIIKVSG